MKREEKVAKGITRALGLGVLMRYRAGVVFLLSGLLIIIVAFKMGANMNNLYHKTTNREAEMKVNVLDGLKFRREVLTLLNWTVPSW